jgi:hypothetical protein
MVTVILTLLVDMGNYDALTFIYGTLQIKGVTHFATVLDTHTDI